MGHFTVTPAYGRDYKTGDEALHAWNSGKDFKLQCTPEGPYFGGTYCSIRNFRNDLVMIRYNGLQDFVWNRKEESGAC